MLDGGNGDVSSQVLFFSSMPKYINYEKQLNDIVSTPISQTAVANDSKTQDRCSCMVHWIEGKKMSSQITVQMMCPMASLLK